ncbi:hypothetical protein D3C78_1337380 [compost metagenome]
MVAVPETVSGTVTGYSVTLPVNLTRILATPPFSVILELNKRKLTLGAESLSLMVVVARLAAPGARIAPPVAL